MWWSCFGSGFDRAVADLSGFTRIWLLSWFHRNTSWRPMVMPRVAPPGVADCLPPAHRNVRIPSDDPVRLFEWNACASRIGPVT